MDILLNKSCEYIFSIFTDLGYASGSKIYINVSCIYHYPFDGGRCHADRDEDTLEFIPGDWDHDKLTTYSEAMYYGTAPDNKRSLDSDDFEDWWETRYYYTGICGDDPFIIDPSLGYTKAFDYGDSQWKNIEEIDPDGDGIPFIDEYKFYQLGANPDYKDIFVEVDWMKNNNGKEYKMNEESINQVIYPFVKRGIILHIDDGCMGGGVDTDGDGYTGNDGGGGSVPYTSEHIRRYSQTGPLNDLPDYKKDYFDSSSRGNIFQYVLFCDKAKAYYRGEWYMNPGGIASQGNDDFLITSKYSYSNKLHAVCFMHELGHTLDLYHSVEKDGTDRDPSINPTGSETVKDTVMYWKAKDAKKVDYLQQEWGAIDLT